MPLRVKRSSRSEYGIRALLELAQRRGQGPIQSREIAERQAIPDAYLNQLLLILRKAGLVQSVRGPAGGHLLARDPDRITMAEVIGALEGLPHFEQSSGEEANSDSWAVRWDCGETDEAVARGLREISVESLLARHHARENILRCQV